MLIFTCKRSDHADSGGRGSINFVDILYGCPLMNFLKIVELRGFSNFSDILRIFSGAKHGLLKKMKNLHHITITDKKYTRLNDNKLLRAGSASTMLSKLFLSGLK